MSDPTHETWLPVVGFEGLYEVSDLGHVRSLPRRGGNNRTYGGTDRKPYLHKGYPEVGLSRSGKRTQRAVHQLVLEAFVGPRPAGQEACHGDGDPSNCRLSNLRWDTHQGNMRDQYRHGTRVMGPGHPSARLDDATIVEIRERYEAGVAGTGPRITQRELGLQYGVSSAYISVVTSGKLRRSAGGPTRLPRPAGKLTMQQVAAIRERHASGLLRREIAEMYGIVPGYVSALVSGRARTGS